MVLKHGSLQETHQVNTGTLSSDTILGVKWQGHTTNTEVLEKADLPSIKVMLMLRQLCWAGHLVRMVNSRMPKFVFYSELLATANTAHIL